MWLFNPRIPKRNLRSAKDLSRTLLENFGLIFFGDCLFLNQFFFIVLGAQVVKHVLAEQSAFDQVFTPDFPSHFFAGQNSLRAELFEVDKNEVFDALAKLPYREILQFLGVLGYHFVSDMAVLVVT